MTAQPRPHLDKRLNYLLIEYKQNTMRQKEKCSTPPVLQGKLRALSCLIFKSGFNDTIVWLKPVETHTLPAQGGITAFKPDREKGLPPASCDYSDNLM